MKKCDHFKDLILTDYIDGELGKESVTDIENHLLDCNDCRVFFNQVRNNATLPLRQAPRQAVPGVLWDSIKQKIEHKNQVTHPVAEMIEKFKGILALPRMIPVFASFVLMFLAGSATLNTIQVQQTQAKDQGEYLVSLLSPASSDTNDSATPIEHYFL